MFRHQKQFSKLARGALIGFAFAATTGSATGAQARQSGMVPATQDSQLLRTAWAIVRVNVVGRECPMFYAVDRARVQDIEQTLFNKGLDRFGKDKLRQAVNAVEGELSTEFEADGAETWCPAQRTHFDSLGVRDLVGAPRE